MKISLGFKLVVVSFLLLNGCVAMQVAREVQSGRAALRVGAPKNAIPHFEAAARLDPDYIADFTLPEVGVWTYLGRAYYEAGDRGKALESLKQARERHPDDPFARIYLGLVEAQNGTRTQGIREMESGLKGLLAWQEQLAGPYKPYWDPGRYLARGVNETLALIKEEETDWNKVSDSIGWLARKYDEELGEVRRKWEKDVTGSARDT